MPQSQAVVLIDHHGAQIQHLADGRGESVKEHRHYTRQHGSNVRSEHDFFSDVYDALETCAEILVLGSHTAQADFRRYVFKHRPGLAEPWLDGRRSIIPHPRKLWRRRELSS